MCRSPFFAPLAQLARNFALASIIEQRFPVAYKRRLAEAVEDGEIAPASGLLQLPVAFISNSTPTSGTGLLEHGAENVFPPCLAVDLQLFEPRYLSMVDRVMASMACKFAVQPRKESAMGAILRLETATRLADGRVRVKAYVESRYRVASRGEVRRRAASDARPVAEASESLASGDDAVASGDDAVASGDDAVASGDDALAIDELEGMGGLYTVMCEPVLDDDESSAVPRGASGSPWDDATMLNHGRLARCATRLVAESGARAALAINGHFGQPPAPPGALSFYLTALLDLSPAQRRACIETTSLAERHRVLLDFLTSIVPVVAAPTPAHGSDAAGIVPLPSDIAAAGQDGLRRRAAAATVPPAAADGPDEAAAPTRRVATEAPGGAPLRGAEPLDNVPVDEALWLLSRTSLRGDSVISWGASQAQGPAGVVFMLLMIVVLLLAWNPSQFSHADRSLAGSSF
jgi:hypothetical protein